jgi:aspartyl-tRNA(Asn)/glutamyl-tRNA(Gln) amidotransferase subunit B
MEVKGKIGLEIHVYPVTKEKLFCRCNASREKGLKENINICPICTGQPGSKPMRPNEEAVRKAVAVGLMLNCKINNRLIWKRKHYDWPDLPKGYQNTLSGKHAFPVGEKGEFLDIGIWSMHLEEDPGSWDPETGCVDYNRSGLPLLEIITAPDFESSEEVTFWLKKLRQNLEYLKAVDSNAGMKADVNVNLIFLENGKEVKKTERVEIKNITSFEDIGKAIDFEILRQEKEGSVLETRRYDSKKEKTIRMREKEEGDDYRFISDPDLVNLDLSKEFVNEIKESLPESPDEKLNRFVKKYGIDKKDSEILSKNFEIAEFFEEVVKAFGEDKEKVEYVKRWVLVELLRHLNYMKKSLEEVNIKVEDFSKLLELVKSGKITDLKGKEILNSWEDKSSNPELIIEGKERIDNEKDLEKVISKVLKENGKAVESYRSGEEKAFNFLLGAVMKETNKRADYNIARKVLEKFLKN